MLGTGVRGGRVAITVAGGGGGWAALHNALSSGVHTSQAGPLTGGLFCSALYP